MRNAAIHLMLKNNDASALRPAMSVVLQSGERPRCAPPKPSITSAGCCRWSQGLTVRN